MGNNKIIISLVFLSVIVLCGIIVSAQQILFSGDIEADLKMLKQNNLTMNEISFEQHPGGIISPEFNSKAIYFSQLSDIEQGRNPYYPRNTKVTIDGR